MRSKEPVVVLTGGAICYRMFTSLKETLTKFVQSPFGVVKAEEELVDPAKVLRVYL